MPLSNERLESILESTFCQSDYFAATTLTKMMRALVDEIVFDTSSQVTVEDVIDFLGNKTTESGFDNAVILAKALFVKQYSSLNPMREYRDRNGMSEALTTAIKALHDNAYDGMQGEGWNAKKYTFVAAMIDCIAKEKARSPFLFIPRLNDCSFNADPHACYLMAQYLDSTHQAPQQAALLYEKASDQRHIAASYQYAKLCLSGKTVERDISKAINCLEWAAEKGHPELTSWSLFINLPEKHGAKFDKQRLQALIDTLVWALQQMHMNTSDINETDYIKELRAVAHACEGNTLSPMQLEVIQVIIQRAEIDNSEETLSDQTALLYHATSLYIFHWHLSPSSGRPSSDNIGAIVAYSLEKEFYPYQEVIHGKDRNTHFDSMDVLAFVTRLNPKLASKAIEMELENLGFKFHRTYTPA